MKRGVSLVECLVYLVGCAYVALLTAMIIVTMFDNRDGGVLGEVNSFLACHAVMQALVDDVRGLHCGKGLLIAVELHALALLVDGARVSWRSARGVISRSVVRSGVTHTALLLKQGASLSFERECFHNACNHNAAFCCRVVVKRELVSIERSLFLGDLICK